MTGSLRGEVGALPAVSEVYLALGTTIRVAGSKEAFLRRTCGKRYAFRVGDRQDWSYLLPSRLPRGRYVLDVYAIDNAFNKGTPTRVAFRVR